jgi:tripeptide aminopeptidase
MLLSVGSANAWRGNTFAERDDEDDEKDDSMKLNVVDEFVALASINSPSRREGAVARYLTERIGQLGLTATVDDSAALSGSDTGNIVVRVPGNAPGPTIMLCAHMDTVGPTEGMVPVLRDGVITSNGETVLGADDKAGIAMIVAALSELLTDNTPHGAIEVVFSVQEESGLFGVSYLTEPLSADFGYILDGDGPVGTIVNQAPSKVDLDFVVEGRAAISSPTGQRWPSRSGAPMGTSWNGRFKPSWMPSTPRRRPRAPG